MARLTPVAWWCNSGHKNDPASKVCHGCSQTKVERHAQVHVSERAVVYRHPLTGEYKTPARADMPMPSQYAKAGFERHEIQNMGDWERASGSVHEATNFNPGNEPEPQDPNEVKPNKQVIKAIAEDVAAAIASGPWTGHERLTG